MKFIGYFMMIFILLGSLVSCTSFLPGRSYLSQMEDTSDDYFKPNKDFPVVAGDNGRYWYSDSERKDRTPASEYDERLERESDAMRSQLERLEAALPENEQNLYNSVRGHLPTDSEKIYYLELPSKSERLAYAESKGLETQTKRYGDNWENRLATRQSEVMLGMSKEEVMSSAGRPARVEVAGNPRNENERWQYSVGNTDKYIYFEGGKVEGWSSAP